MPSHSLDCDCLGCREYWAARACAVPADMDYCEGFLSQSPGEEAEGIFYGLSDGALLVGGGTTTAGSERSERLIYNKDT